MRKNGFQKKQEQEIILGDLPHKPHYDVTKASEGHSNIAAVLAGFAFAAVVLVMQTDLSESDRTAIFFRDWASIAFLLGFFGCIVSAFVFATVMGEEILTPRAHTMALLGGLGFSVSSNLVIYGLATITKIFLSADIAIFVRGIIPFVMILSPLFVIFSAIDPLLGFGDDSSDDEPQNKSDIKPISTKEILSLFALSFLPLFVALTIKWIGVEIPFTTLVLLYKPVMVTAFAIALLSAAATLIISSFTRLQFRFSLPVSGIMICIHSCVIGILILMI